jgi:phosphoglycolate phosphatase-like HAD superfamily hydrolase
LAGEYVETRVDAGVVMVRTDCVGPLDTIDAIIFDCDGVLIDARDSYTKAIHATVAYFMRELFGVDFPATQSLMELIHTFKKSGGFNNEWDVVYSLLLYLFNKLPKRLQGKLMAKRHQLADKALSERFFLAKNMFQSQLQPQEHTSLLDLGSAFALARRADSTGISSIEREFKNTPDSKDVFEVTKQFLAYPGSVGESLLTTIFEEIFCGSDLFEKQYDVEPQFYLGRGLIAKEKLIVSQEILDDLASIIGQYNFGIATGRPYYLAKYTLGGLLDTFDRKASVFIEDVLEAERNERGTGGEIDLTKPNPFSLLQSAEGLNPFNRAAYVGDSAEDVIMVKKACRLNNHFLSVGVYSTSSFREDLISNFIELETDVILPSIKELAGLIENFGMMKR